MTIFQLECFYAIANSLNFTQTATSLYISQPALSRSIASLEKELGFKLLVRHSKKVALTPEGRVFSEECKKILDTTRIAIKKSQSATEHLEGTIKLGVPVDSFEPITIKLFNYIKEKTPRIQIELKFSYPTQLLRNLESGTVDAIISSGFPKSEEFNHICLEDRPNCIVLPKNHKYASRRTIELSKFKDEPFILLTKTNSSVGYDAVLSQCIAAGFVPNIADTAESISSLLTKIGCGLGVSILYREHTPYSSGLVSFVQLNNGGLGRYLVWIENNNPCLNQVADLAKELFLAQK